MSFNDLLASASSASGPSASLPQGGLSKALSALLAPLLSDPEVEASSFGYGPLSQQALLAKRAAFQPRRYLDMTADLLNRTSDTKGEMYQAIQLAQLLKIKSDTDSIKQTLRQKILLDRRTKKAASDQQQLHADQSIKIQEASMKREQSVQGTFSSVPSYIFPSVLHGQAKQMEPDLAAEPDEDVMRSFLQAWQTELIMTDGEASGRLHIALQQTKQSNLHKSFLLRMRISQLGFAWVWLHFRAISEQEWCARVDRVNVLAESEVEDVSALESTVFDV